MRSEHFRAIEPRNFLWLLLFALGRFLLKTPGASGLLPLLKLGKNPTILDQVGVLRLRAHRKQNIVVLLFCGGRGPKSARGKLSRNVVGDLGPWLESAAPAFDFDVAPIASR